MAATMATIWNNQKEMTKSHERIDEQFCVLGRLLIGRFNEILIHLGSEEIITGDVIEKSFREWASFKSRPGFREFMLEWFLGKPLAELPLPPPKKEEAPVAPSPKAEGAQEFGGNYVNDKADSDGNPSTFEAGQQNTSPGPTDAVPKGQDADGAVPGQG